MFNNDKIQYVNIKQYDKQLKIDNQILKDKKIIKAEHTSFLIDDFLSPDAITKIKILQKNIHKTYLTTICESLEQKVVLADDFFDENHEIKRLNATHNIAIPKIDINKKVQYFNHTGIDYIFSPFHILYHHLIANQVNTNSINILITHDIFYALILNDEKKIVYSAVRKLTAFDEIQNSDFEDINELENQNLFNEIHQLEIQDIITSITNDFYETSNEEVFCQSIAIFYTIKQLTNEQITTIKDALMLEVEYQSIDFNSHLFTLSQQSNASKLSFIHTAKKTNKKSFLPWFFGMIITSALVAGIFFYMQQQEDMRKQKIENIKKAKKAKAAKILADKKAADAKIKLPNHKLENKKISTLVLSILNTIPSNAVLSEIELQENDLTFVCDLLNEETFNKDIKPNLLKLYKTSEILLIQENKPTFNAIIANSGLIVNKVAKDNSKQKYRANKFISQKNIIKKIQTILPKDSIVDLESKSKKKAKIKTYNFSVTTLISTPKDFFDIIKKLNKLPYSLSIKFPIEFAQTTQGLETTFNLQFNQFHKE